MTFQPIVGNGGYSGWRLLARTAEKQKATISLDPVVARDAAYIREKIPQLSHVDGFLSDFKLLRSSLGAFGLEGDIGKKAFLQKILESDLADPKSFANRLSDKRYRDFAEAFSFSSGVGRPAGLAGKIILRYVDAEFEARIGEVDGNLRLALNAKRELTILASSSVSEKAQWYSILGSLPLRKVFEGALGFGDGFSKLPIDRQLTEVKDAAHKRMGIRSPSDFSDPANIEKLVQSFLLRAEARSGVQSSYSTALALLSG